MEIKTDISVVNEIFVSQSESKAMNLKELDAMLRSLKADYAASGEDHDKKAIEFYTKRRVELVKQIKETVNQKLADS